MNKLRINEAETVTVSTDLSEFKKQLSVLIDVTSDIDFESRASIIDMRRDNSIVKEEVSELLTIQSTIANIGKQLKWLYGSLYEAMENHLQDERTDIVGEVKADASKVGSYTNFKYFG